MTNVAPLGKRLLVKRLEAIKTMGGIILPDSAQERPKQAKVVALGTDNLDGLNIGDEVFFSPYAGVEVSHLGEEGYLILPQEDVLCVIES